MSEAAPRVGFAPAAEQRRILTARYFATWLGDPVTALILVAQAPLIGWLCTVVWGAVETDTPSLRFVLALSAVWFGCVNACREIVKERAIVERERLLGLSMTAYVLSRLHVLGGLAFVQVALLQGAVEWKIAIHGNLLIEVVALWMAAMAGSALGLLVSAVSARQERAVGVVPLLLLPQVLFSELAIPPEHFNDALDLGEELMPVHHAYVVFEQLAAGETEWGAVALAFVALGGLTLTLGLATLLALSQRRSIV